MDGASTGDWRERLTPGSGRPSRTALDARARDARGIDPSGQTVSLRLPDPGVNGRGADRRPAWELDATAPDGGQGGRSDRPEHSLG